MKNRTTARLVFWPCFLVIVCGIAYYYWQKQAPQQTKRYLALAAHPNAEVASDAWSKLRNLFYTDWAAYYLLLDEVGDATPISFLIEKHTIAKEDRRVFVARGKPIYYKSEQVYCRTLGEALLAIAYNNPEVDAPFEGDWQNWWAENRAAFK